MHIRTENLNDRLEQESPTKLAISSRKTPHQHAQTMDKETLNSQRRKLDEREKQNYPRIISLIFKNQSLLEIGLFYHENKRCLLVEGRSPKKETVYREIFDKDILENTWYNMVLTLTTKNSFILSINGETIRSFNHAYFGYIFENLEQVITFGVGTPLVQNTSFTCEIDPDKLCYKGQIKNFHLFPTEFGADEGRALSRLPERTGEDHSQILNEIPESLLATSVFNLKGYVRSNKIAPEDQKFLASIKKDAKK
jgi:hypothetical protein